MEIVQRARPRQRVASSVVLCLAVATAGLTATSCRVDENDIHRWESTARGPDKLRAVLTHDKYDTGLRVEAAVSLVRMKPRQGRRIGIGMMVESLVAITPEARAPIVAALVPLLIDELVKPPTAAQPGKPALPDPSFPYKDAAYAMLANDAAIIADPALKDRLHVALTQWAMADFERRLANRTQAYGMEQLLRMIGPSSVVGLPKLMTRTARRLDQMASIVAELGDAATKAEASANLVAIAKYVTSNEWVSAKTPDLQAANAASKLEPTEKQFAAQLAQYQEEELFRVFGSMKKVGGRPAIDFLLSFAEDKAHAEKRRQAALAALEGRLDRNNRDDVERILRIAIADAPDVVIDQAFRRVGEMPRELVVERLYGLVKGGDNWKIRRAAGATILRMSTVKHVGEFMGKLPPSKGFAMPEALTYGALLGDLKEQPPGATTSGATPAPAPPSPGSSAAALEELKKHFASGSGVARTTALAYYFTFGTANDLPAMKPFESDRTRAPTCDADQDCKWVCEVAKEGSKERELKDIKTVGDFVRHCVEPAMRDRKPEPEKVEKP